MPAAESVHTVLKAVFCCHILRRRVQVEGEAGADPAPGLQTQLDHPQGLTDSTSHIIAPYPPSDGQSNDTDTPTPRSPTSAQSSTSTTPRPLRSPTTETQLEPVVPLDIDSPKMLSSGTLYRLSQSLEDVQALRTAIIRSPSVTTFHSIILPRLYEVLQREEIQLLFEVGDGDRRCISQRLKFCKEVLELAYWDVDSGGDRRLAGWVERGLGSIIEANPGHIRALTLLGRSWLLKAQQYLSKISEDGSMSSSSGGSFPFTNTDWTSADEDRDTAEQDRKRQDGVYVDARTCLMPAVEFLGRAVYAMEISGGVGVRGGEIYVLQAEANMSLGNVTVSSEAQPYFRTAVEALRAASLIESFALPGHLERYLRSFEFVLYDRP